MITGSKCVSALYESIGKRAPEKLLFYEKYGLLPDGHCILHGLVNSEWIVSAFADRSDKEIMDRRLYR